jgi:hypothetical protein
MSNGSKIGGRQWLLGFVIGIVLGIVLGNLAVGVAIGICLAFAFAEASDGQQGKGRRMDDQRIDRESGLLAYGKVKMDKKYFDGGPCQVLPMVLGIMLAAPLGLALVRWLGLTVTELPMLVAGSISGALVVILSWLIMVLMNQASAKK